MVLVLPPDLVTLNVWDSASWEVTVELVKNLMVYWSPGGATKLVKEYLPSDVLTGSWIVSSVGGLESWFTRTISKLVGSVDTEVHSIVLVWVKSHCAPTVGCVIVIADCTR